MAVPAVHPRRVHPMDRLLSLLAGVGAPDSESAWLERMAEGMAAVADADAVAVLSARSDGTTVDVASWRRAGALPLALPPSAPVPRFVQASLVQGVVRAAAVGLPWSGYARAAAVPLLVDGERVGLVVLGWLPGGSRHPTRQERAALGGAGRYLAEALRRLELDARLRHLATHDPVTGLWNREGFRQRFAALRQSADASGRRLVVALVDLDEFRSLNDVFGHGAGDQVLRTVGRRLSRRVGPGGAAGRIGGDEFALAQILDTAQTPEAWLRRLLGATDRDIRFGSRRGHVGVSVGVAMMPDDGGDLESLFGRADRALYSVKRRGGHGGRRFEAAIEREQESVRAVRDGLADALAQHRLELHYQPQVDMLDRRVVGFEALLRWRDPGRGLRLPGEFLPLLRDETLIARIGRWTLGEALGQWREWRGECHGARLAVNVAPEWFLSGGFLDDVLAALDGAGLGRAPGLELEITESAALADIARARETMGALHALGITVALDDFGTGYASLGYLNDLQADSIKIDISFTRRLLEQADTWMIMQAILLMAAGSGRTVIAEGVESAAVEEAVLRLGVGIAQGFLYARPMPPDRIRPFVHAFARTRRADGVAAGRRAREVFAGAGLITSIYLHLGWMDRVVVAARHPAMATADGLAAEDECLFLRWAAGQPAPGVADLARAHRRHHALAQSLLGERETDPSRREARIAAFLRAQSEFFRLASAVFFGATRELSRRA